MKKRISLILCLVFACGCLTACGNSNETLTYDQDTIVSECDWLLESCNSADEASIEQLEEYPESYLEVAITQNGLPVTADSYLDALDTWTGAVSECGAYVGIGDYSIEASASDITVTTNAEFENRTATLEFVFDENLKLDTFSVNADYKMGEILKKAGLNTILGMGTVFAVLIFISILISLFKYIPAIVGLFKNRNKKSEETMSQSAAPAASTTTVADEPEELADDLELVAVIAAAIAEYEGTSTDGFVVRSIRRRPSNKWAAR